MIRRPYFWHHFAIIFGILLLIGLLLPARELSLAVVAQTLPPRPTLTPADGGDDEDDDDDEDDEAESTPVATATAIATATVAPTATLTPTATLVPRTTVLPTPMTLPVTGARAGGGGLWVSLSIGLIVSLLLCGMGSKRAVGLWRRRK